MPESQDEYDQAWAQIVADLTGSSTPETTDPTETDVGSAESAGSAESSAGPAAPSAAAEPPPAPPAPAPQPPAPGPDQGLAALFEPLRRREPAKPAPDAFVDNWEDEGHFTPPPPPEIPEGTPIKRMAWAGTLGGPLVLILIALTGWDPPRIVSIGAGLATIAGFITLVWNLPESREDGWDDGARL